MFRSLKFFIAILQIGGYISVNYANPVTNFNSGTKTDTFVFELPKDTQDAQSLLSRVSTLSASGRSYGDTSVQSQVTNPSSSSSANGRILSQPPTSDKDAITYPDDIIRDSYGNIVTPYTTLVEDPAHLHTSSPKPSGIGPIGVLTDVNKDKGQQLQFVIPSYSDGITELQGPYKPSLINNAVATPIQILLPPLSSGNYNYPSLGTNNPSADNSYQNEIGGSFSSSAQGINPLPTGPTAITTNGHIGSANNSPNIYTSNLQLPFSSPSSDASQQPNSKNNQQSAQAQPSSSSSTSLFSRPSFASIPNVPQNNGVASTPTQGSSDFTSIHVSSPELNTPSSTFSFSNIKPQKDAQFVNQIPVQIQVESGKYTGGFGGAPGILGEQKIPGYAVKPSVNQPALTASAPQVSNDHHGLNSIQANTAQNLSNPGNPTVPNALQGAVSSIQNYQGNLAPAKPNTLSQRGNYGQSNTNHGSFQFGTAVSPIPTPNSQIYNSGKYTGGFGGPPGIFSPFDNSKTGKNIASDNTATSTIGPKKKY